MLALVATLKRRFRALNTRTALHESQSSKPRTEDAIEFGARDLRLRLESVHQTSQQHHSDSAAASGRLRTVRDRIGLRLRTRHAVRYGPALQLRPQQEL